jgi:hypothetical protein
MKFKSLITKELKTIHDLKLQPRESERPNRRFTPRREINNCYTWNRKIK